MVSFLQIIPYPVYPPRNGGALRCVHLLRQLSRHHSGRAVIYQNAADLAPLQKELGQETIVHSPQAGPWNLPQAAGGRLLGLRYRWLTRSLRGPAESFFLDAHPIIRDMQRTGPGPDFIIFEGVGTLSLAPMLRRWAPNSISILDAHNIDHILLQQEMSAAKGRGEPVGKQSKRWLEVMKRREQHLARYVDTFFACSEQDRDVLAGFNPSVTGYVVPNGVDCGAFQFRAVSERPERPNVLFCGSLGYLANRDGLEWFGTRVWPVVRERVKGVTFTIVGRGGNQEWFGSWLSADDIRWVGEVEDVLPYYHEATLAVCPLRIGSGTRLKILEALSSGTPMVSTTLGAEGLLEKCGDALTIADSAGEFGDAVCRLLANHPVADRLSRAGRQIALSAFDWNVIGKTMDSAIGELLAHRGIAERRVQ